MEKRVFTVLDYPEVGMKTGRYTGSSPAQVAHKVFNKLCKKYNFYDNEGGTKYLVFYLEDVNNKKIYPFIGTPVVLHKPIEVNYGDNTLKINHRNIVTKYTKDMGEVFSSQPEKSL